MKETKVCTNSNCKHKGETQPISNFHIKSRRGDKVYRESICSDCKNKKDRERRKNKKIIAHTGKKEAHSDDSFYHVVLREYNELTADNMTLDEFHHAVNAIRILSKLSKRQDQHPRSHSRTKLSH